MVIARRGFQPYEVSWASSAVTVREPEARHVRREGEGRGPGRAQGAHRGRQGHAGHGQDVSAERSHRGHPASGRGSRPRKGRHHRLSGADTVAGKKLNAYGLTARPASAKPHPYRL